MRAASHGDDIAYVFLGDGENESARLSFAELDSRARAIAAHIQERIQQGERALLLYPPGLEYIEAFFASLYARVIAVPAYPPSGRHLQRLESIFSDAAPVAIMTTQTLREKFVAAAETTFRAEGLEWIATNQIVAGAENWRPVAIEPEELAFLQYTSGSTGNPRGVMVTHGNLLANQALIKESFDHNESSTLVGWLPLYHDMGLIGNILQPLYVGATAVLMSPMAFLERPVRWLQAISKYRAHTSGGPNFAFDLCVRKIDEAEKRELDLSCWRIAFSGAEPVRASTLERFAMQFRACGFDSKSFYPCYGLAEATLVVTAPTGRRAPQLRRVDRAALEENRAKVGQPDNSVSMVGCGRAWPDHDVAIVDPSALEPCAEGKVGEVWVAGPSVAQGYWRQPSATERSFHALLEGRSTRRFLRTGDLGFIEGGELYITGRLKDLVIIAGRNYYPQDFELAIEEQVEETRPGCCAAFSAPMGEEEALVVIAEPQRGQLSLLRDSGSQALFRKIREVLTTECGAAPQEIVLVRPGSIPKTSSGKIRRAECRRSYLDGALDVVARTGRSSEVDSAIRDDLTSSTGAQELLRGALSLLPVAQKATFITRFLRSTSARLIGVPENELDETAGILRNGLDSLRMVELKHAIESLLGAEVPLPLLLSDMSFAELAEKLIDMDFGASSSSEDASSDGALSFTQRAMWAVHRLEPAGVAYNLHLALKFVGPLDEAALKSSLDDMLKRHAMLRSVYGIESGDPVVSTRPLPPLGEWFSIVDAAYWTKETLQSDIGRRVETPFDLEHGPVLRAHLYRGCDGGPILLLCAHH
ncbi:MAG: AMP-binding protein, partial [Methylocystis sp.]